MRATYNPNWKKYRCVYCKKTFNSREVLPSHEVQCPMRETVRRQWAMEIERAKRREAKSNAATSGDDDVRTPYGKARKG